MDIKKCREVTSRYYSKWLGQDGILTHNFKGVQYIYSVERNCAVYGYGAPFDLYVFCQEGRIVISYGDKAEKWLGILKDKVEDGMSAAEIRETLEFILERKASHSVKYVLEDAESALGAKILVGEDYRKYESFWRKCHPGSKDIGWVKEYFDEMVQNHTCIGMFADGMLVSCTDAPGIPYMEDEVCEIGINTLAEYRGRGYTTVVCKKCIDEIICHAKVPLWSADIKNHASHRLAEKVGFTKFGEVVLFWGQ